MRGTVRVWGGRQRPRPTPWSPLDGERGVPRDPWVRPLIGVNISHPQDHLYGLYGGRPDREMEPSIVRPGQFQASALAGEFLG